MKNIAKHLPYLGLISCSLFVFGCAANVSSGDANQSVPGARATTSNRALVSLSDTSFEDDKASYTWKVNSAPIKSVVFGSNELVVSPAQLVGSITLDLKESKSGDEILARIGLESKDKNGPAFTTRTMSSDIGIDKGQNIRKLVAPADALDAVHDGTVLAKGVGAFPSLVVHLNASKSS